MHKPFAEMIVKHHKQKKNKFEDLVKPFLITIGDIVLKAHSFPFASSSFLRLSNMAAKGSVISVL